MSNVAIKELLDTPWFKVTVSVAKIVGSIALTGCIGLIGATLLRISTVETSMASIGDDQIALRATLEAQQRLDASFRGEVRVEIRDVQSGIALVREDVATIKGILQGMSREARAPALPPLQSFPHLQREEASIPALLR